jgi:hypothetical protein
MTVGGVDTYYDYDEKQWKSRRLGGGPIDSGPVCPAPKGAPGADKLTATRAAAEGRPARAKKLPA